MFNIITMYCIIPIHRYDRGRVGSVRCAYNAQEKSERGVDFR